MSPSVEIIIVSYNTRSHLSACLASLAEAMPACASGIVVVDNASTDGSVEMVRSSWPAVEVIALERNVGFGAANNVALRRCVQPFALLLNGDTVVPAGAIDRLLARLEARGATAAGPRLVDAAGRPEISFGPMLGPARELVQRWRVRRASRGGVFARRATRRLVERERLVDWVSGACLLVRIDPAAAVGFFDERYFLYEEDVDLCATLRAAGGTILFAPAAEVVHIRGASAGATGAAGTSHYDRSHLAFYEKHAPGWARWLRLWLRLRGRA
jgi:N-acetylglucosaminyl-diphospho-decaprenol L-rhamnosyltransferase